MNAAATAGLVPGTEGPSALRQLEAESIYILREAIAQSEKPALLFSGGKDSAVLLHLAEKAFWPAPLPMPLLHIDTGHNFGSVLRFRDARANEAQARLIVAGVEDSIAAGRVADVAPGQSRNPLQTVTLLDAIAAHSFDLLLGGARRDEEKARAKERVFSLRDAFGGWDPKRQRPELWRLYNAKHLPGENVRVFPLSDWTELDIWRYIAEERVALPELYFAHEREVVERDGMLLAVTPVTPPRVGETVTRRSVRYRTVGDATCTGAVESTAADVTAVLAEVARSTLTERGATRADDRASEAAMEDRKKQGYF